MGVIHLVDVLGDTFGISIKGTHQHQQLNELGVVQPPRMFAKVADYMTGQDGGVDLVGLTELLVPRLFDNVVQEFGDAPLGGEESALIRLVGGPFSGFLEAFGLHHVLGDEQVVGLDV